MVSPRTVRPLVLLSVLALGTLGPAAPAQGQAPTAAPTIDVGVVVDDLEASLQFYREVLGMAQRRTIDISEAFGRRSGLTGGAPTEIRVLTLGTGDAATEWKLMAFADGPGAADEADITDQRGMQYITLQVDRLGPYLERAREHGVQPLGETPIALGETDHFLLLQAPEGTFVEVIGPLEQ
jgi:catechol 2,3-dioxygenase-like lactoylglutathione lyase family enzyme